jgi:hypothetical protein
MKNNKVYPWILVGLLWFVALLNYLDRQMLSTMQSSMQLDIKELAIAENFGRDFIPARRWVGLERPLLPIIRGIPFFTGSELSELYTPCCLFSCCTTRRATRVLQQPD